MSCKYWIILVVLGLFVAVLMVPADAGAQGPRPRVIASFSILADVARNVAGDAADVDSFIPLGANPHGYTPSAQQVLDLTEADRVFVVGANFEEGLLPVLQEAGGENVVVVSSCVPIRPVFFDTFHADDEQAVSGTTGETAARCAAHYDTAGAAFGLEIDPYGAEFLGPLYALDCGDDLADGGDGEVAHAHGSCDPHVWMDPVNAGLWALMIRDTLSELDPDHVEVYAANAAAYLDELAALNTEVQAIIDEIPPAQRYIVTNHLAFNYFTERYGLRLVGVVIPGGSGMAEPSVEDVLDLTETIQDYDVPAIFSSALISDDLAEQIADETGAEIVQLYTGTLSAPDEGAGTYIDYTRANARRMADALK